jgi:prepilin-type N-terminal cleavage/methylation domain-containing protein
MNLKKSTTSQRSNGFTLVELLTVIAVIAIIAGLLLPVFNSIAKKSLIQRAQSEREQLETALAAYYGKYHFYPPSSALATANGLTNQLYYELIGTTSTNSLGTLTFITLDGASTINSSVVGTAFGVAGFMNCTKGNGDDAIEAQTFLPALPASRIATNSAGVYMIVTGVSSGPGYTPMPGVSSLAGGPANPWRYLYPGTNNPNSYDLWLQIIVGGKTNLICNWRDTPQINSPLP